ncbi:MAG TPA: enoyl-CoA hydratase/isomerase family protein [Alphaproteobacteria bacterium]|jgi:enoyl-CoA hydratase/carnithine racemase|nr:enoyl-CoA hydratase/isomerase family protein [Alphaproteobacteria bacterium]MDP6271259.1 enoyl-CoA hydratase/isomerase family protein [Alphaproteobacteria bacterium]HJM50256.1 enoyl-CoA hydratase/isomerase family protein [Alphaproteobacteria bacterium]
MSSTIIVEHRGPVAWITLNRPQAMNALTMPLMRELGSALESLEAHPDVRVLVLTGAGRAFCGGADLKDVAGATPGAAIAAFIEVARPVVSHLAAFPKPVIAAVNGLALAGGLELVLCCDLAVAAEGAKLGDAHANYGLIPAGGGSVRLTRRIGPQRAKLLLFTGRFVSAREALDLDLVTAVCADADLMDEVQELAQTIAAKSPLGLKRMKSLVADATRLDEDEALRAEERLAIEHSDSADAREGLAAFGEKRNPAFEGR